MKYRFLFLAGMALLSAGCGKKTPVGDVPESFYYKGAPVDPSCFLDTAAQLGDGISLNVCTGKNKIQPEYKEDHFYGVEIADSPGASPPYVYYRYLGEIDGNHVIHTISSGGGTGQYASVRIVTLDGNLLRMIKRYGGGDRCNSAVVEASVKGSSVNYTLNITPFDVALLTNGMEAGFKRVKDIPSDSTLCAGIATYEDDKLKKLELTMNPSELADIRTEKGECFAAFYKSKYKPHLELEGRDLEDFGTELNAQCGKLGE